MNGRNSSMVKEIKNKVKKKYRNWYQKELMVPSIFGLFVNPFYKIRRDLSVSIKEYAKEINGKVLDFGCGSKPYRDFFDVTEYIGLDIKNDSHKNSRKNVDVFYNGHSIPFNDNYFDNVFSSETLEHVFNIDEILSEINRVLKKNGLFLLTVPFIWDEHEQPNDFARYSSFGLEYILFEHGFKVLSKKKLGNYVDTISQMICTYFYKQMYSKNFFRNMFFQFVFITPTMFLGLVLGRIFPKNQDFYNNNIFLLRKIR